MWMNMTESKASCEKERRGNNPKSTREGSGGLGKKISQGPKKERGSMMRQITSFTRTHESLEQIAARRPRLRRS